MTDRPSQPMPAWMPHLRCFYLFLVLILLILLLPAFDHSEACQLWFSAASLLVLVTSLVTLGRSRFTLWVALLLVVPALVLLSLSHTTGDAGYRVWSWRFSVAVLAATLVPLLRYVLGPEVMTKGQAVRGSRRVPVARASMVLRLCARRALLPRLPRRPAERTAARRRHGLRQCRNAHDGWFG